MAIVKEFKEFIMRGNVLDLAVGVIIGGAFGKIVSSLVDDIIMPPIGFITGGVDFSKIQYVLVKGDPELKTADVAIRYGNFINVLIQFLIVAFCIFLVVKLVNSFRRKQADVPAEPAGPTTSEKLLMEIRDSLRKP